MKTLLVQLPEVLAKKVSLSALSFLRLLSPLAAVLQLQLPQRGLPGCHEASAQYV